MTITHRLDSAKFGEALKKRGWYLDAYGTWCTPRNKILSECDKDWNDALVESIVCSAQEAQNHASELAKPTSNRDSRTQTGGEKTTEQGQGSSLGGEARSTSEPGGKKVKRGE